jgi:hypothetical protein
MYHRLELWLCNASWNAARPKPADTPLRRVELLTGVDYGLTQPIKRQTFGFK